MECGVFHWPEVWFPRCCDCQRHQMAAAMKHREEDEETEEALSAMDWNTFWRSILKGSSRIWTNNNGHQIETAVLRLWHGTKVQSLHNSANSRTASRNFCESNYSNLITGLAEASNVHIIKISPRSDQNPAYRTHWCAERHHCTVHTGCNTAQPR